MAHAAVQGQPVGGLVVQLQEGRRVLELGLRHPFAAGLGQNLAGFVLQQVQAGGGLQVAVEQAVPGQGELGPVLVGFVLGLVEQGAGRSNGRILEGAEGVAAVAGAEALGVQLQAHIVAGQVGIAVGEAGGERLVAHRVAGRVALHRGGGHAIGPVAFDAHVVVVAFQLEPVHRKLQVLGVVQPIADLHEHVVALRVHGVALGLVDAHGPAVSVVEQAPGFVGAAEQEIPIAVDALQAVIGFVAQAVGFVIGGGAHAHPDVLAQVGAFRAAGDEVDDATGGAQAVLGAGAVDHLDAFHHGQIDGVAVAAAVAQRVGLRNAVDQEQRVAAAEGFAGVGQLLAAGRIGRDQIAEHLGLIIGDRHLLLDLVPVDHGDFLRCFPGLAVAPGGGHGDRLQLVVGVLRLGGGGDGGRQRQQRKGQNRQRQAVTQAEHGNPSEKVSDL